jgi:hypothetical protein
MKPTQKTSGASQKKPLSTQPALMAGGVKPVEPVKPRNVYDSPTDAVLTRYIDSRMKQFLTR